QSPGTGTISSLIHSSLPPVTLIWRSPVPGDYGMAGARQTGGKSPKKIQAKTTMTDAAIKAKTGKDWGGGFSALDKAGARTMAQAASATLAREDMGAGDWYGQMIAVSYERARGIRAMNQKCDGEFSVSVTRVMAAPLGKLYAAATAKPETWFPKG